MHVHAVRLTILSIQGVAKNTFLLEIERGKLIFLMEDTSWIYDGLGKFGYGTHFDDFLTLWLHFSDLHRPTRYIQVCSTTIVRKSAKLT